MESDVLEKKKRRDNIIRIIFFTLFGMSWIFFAYWSEINNYSKKYKYKKIFEIYYNSDYSSFCEPSIEECYDKITLLLDGMTQRRLGYYKNIYYFFIDSGKVKVYNANKEKIEVLDISAIYHEYNFIIDEFTEEIIGVRYKKTEGSEEKIKYFNKGN